MVVPLEETPPQHCRNPQFNLKLLFTSKRLALPTEPRHDADGRGHDHAGSRDHVSDCGPTPHGAWLSDLPAGYRAHSVLLGHQTEDQALAFLRDKGVHPEATERLLAERARAESRIRALPPFAPAVAAQPVQDGQALADISHIMSRPECKAAFPEGKWTAELVEIASLIPAFPSLDIRYGESFGGSALDAANPLS